MDSSLFLIAVFLPSMLHLIFFSSVEALSETKDSLMMQSSICFSSSIWLWMRSASPNMTGKVSLPAPFDEIYFFIVLDVLKLSPISRSCFGVKQPLHAVHQIGGGHFALLAFKGGVIGEINTLAKFQCVGGAVR